MSLIKVANLEKKAIDPFTLGAGIFKGFQYAKEIGGKLGGILAGTNLHNVEKLTLAPKNTWTQRALLSDSLIALKKGVEGKVLATRKPLGILAFSDPEAHMKLMGVHHINSIANKIPHLNTMFDNNKFNAQRLKNILESSADIKDGLRANVAARTAKTTQNVYLRNRSNGLSEAESLLKAQKFSQKLHSRLSEKTFPTMQNLDIGAKYHEALMANNGYGYQALDRASITANKVMNRPNLLNYSKHLYTTPEKNREGIGKYYARILQYKNGQNIKNLPFGKFMKEGTGEIPKFLTAEQRATQNRTFDKLTEIAKQHNITNQPITTEHIKRVADQLPSIRQDALNKVNNFMVDTKNKIFK
jgi:hypothetical protein